MTRCFSLAVFRILFLPLTFDSLTIRCYGDLSELYPFGDLRVSCVWISKLLVRVGKFLAVILFKRFSILFVSFLPSWTLKIWIFRHFVECYLSCSLCSFLFILLVFVWLDYFKGSVFSFWNFFLLLALLGKLSNTYFFHSINSSVLEFLLGWYKSNCGFCIVGIAISYWNSILNKCGYVIHHFNVHCFMIFANDITCCLFYIYLDYGNDVRQKANLISKWAVKQWRQLRTSAMHLAKELLMNVQCNGGSRSFAKETRALKMRSFFMAPPQKLTTTSWEQSLKLILLQVHEKLPKNSTSTILWSFSIWSKLEGWKSSIGECSWAEWKFLKIVILKRHLLLFYATTMNHFSFALWHAMKSEFFMTTSDDQLCGWAEKKLQSTSQS